MVKIRAVVLKVGGWGWPFALDFPLQVLVMNIGLTIWSSNSGVRDRGLVTIQQGSCAKTKKSSLWLHLAVNILGTCLLSASNYCMQSLSSPTREEVDRAHDRRRWVDIGVPSVRNLRRISWSKIIIWWLLALSGIPLYLFYNSAVFSALSATELDVYVGSHDVLSAEATTTTGSTFSIDLPPGAIIYNPIQSQTIQ